MKILFAGQLGLPVGGKSAAGGQEWRAFHLAQEMTRGGHEAVISGTEEYMPKHIKNLNGIGLKRLISLNPEKPGGRLYFYLTAIQASLGSYDALHAQGVEFGPFLLMIRRLKSSLMIVWTLDRLPKSAREMRVLKKLASKVEITTPSRELQQKMLMKAGVKVKYVPDGFNDKEIAVVPASQWGLRADQYVLTTETDTKELRKVALSYKKAGTRKKLVVMLEARGYLKRLSKEFPFLTFVGEANGRSLRSLIEQSHLVLLAGGEVTSETVLWSMEAKRPIVAMTEAMFEEVLGVTARFVAKGDYADLSAAIKSMVNSGHKQAHWGGKARRRARQHFSWERIVEEYRLLYADQVQRVALDSARGRENNQVNPNFKILPPLRDPATAGQNPNQIQMTK